MRSACRDQTQLLAYLILTHKYLIQQCRLVFCQGVRAGAGSSSDAVDELRTRLFLVEEENASLKRVAELELPREVESLKHQVCRGFFFCADLDRNRRRNLST